MRYAERWRNAVTVAVVASLLAVLVQAIAAMAWASDTRHRSGAGWRGLIEGLGLGLSVVTSILLVAVALAISANVWAVTAGPRRMALYTVVALGTYVVVVEVGGFIATVTRSPNALTVAIAMSQWLSGAIAALAAVVISVGYVLSSTSTTSSTSPGGEIA